MHEDGYFDERVAATYDESEGDTFDPAVIDLTVDVLAELAGDGRALEFGIGTGRIALPLARRGVPVHGIDLSKAMVSRLRAKPGGDDIGVSIGDLATTTVDGSFSLTYLVFNTIMNLTTQEAQVACFQKLPPSPWRIEPGEKVDTRPAVDQRNEPSARIGRRQSAARQLIRASTSGSR